MVNGVGLLGYAEGHLTQPCCSFYPLACSHCLSRSLYYLTSKTVVAPLSWAGRLEP